MTFSLIIENSNLTVINDSIEMPETKPMQKSLKHPIDYGRMGKSLKNDNIISLKLKRKKQKKEIFLSRYDFVTDAESFILVVKK